MTREEIINTPKLVDYMLDESIIADSREKLRKRLDEICNLAIKALEQEPKTDVLDKIRAEIDAHREELKTMADDDWYAGKIRGHDCDIEIIDKYKAESEGRNDIFITDRQVQNGFL